MAQDRTRTTSPDPEMMLVPYRRGHRTKRTLIRLASLLLIAVLGFAAGYYRGIRQNLHMISQRDEMAAELVHLQQQAQALQEEVAVTRHGIELERKASEHVRKDNLSLQARIAEQEATISLYKDVLAPDSTRQGLRIKRLLVTPGAGRGQYRYRLILTQTAIGKDNTQGALRMILHGTQQDVAQALPFDRIDSNWPGTEGFAFDFRFFQEISGELDVPDNFVPQQIEVIALPKGRKPAKVERRFKWKLNEVTPNVGKR